jgi:hypothetical protein
MAKKTLALFKSRGLVKLAVLFSLSLFLLYCASAFAQKLEVEYPEIGGIKPETVKTGLPQYVKYVFNFGVAFFGLVAFGALIWGGILYLTSAGQPVRLKAAKDQISSAFLGLIVLLSSYIILTNINPQLVTFQVPALTPIKQLEAPKLPPIKSEEINLIATELPLGQIIENGIWSKERRNDMEDLVDANESFLSLKETMDGQKIEGVADLNKYLKTLTEKCRCEELKGLCTKPTFYALPIGCEGDPCPEAVREKIAEVLIINQMKAQSLSDFQDEILATKSDFEQELRRFQDVEQEVISCQEKTKLLFDLNEHLSMLNYFREQGWRIDTVTIPGAPKSQGDPLTFYCSVAGNIFDYPYTLSRELPPEITVPELFIKETSEELAGLTKFSCPVEIPLGEIVDRFRELAALLVVKLERLASLDEQLAGKITEMTGYVSQCNDKNCSPNCRCIYNPCYNICKYFCALFCKSPCLQGIGGCSGVPCPREEIAKTVEEIKKIEDEALKTIGDIKNIFSDVSYSLGDPGNLWSLKNIRQGMSLCYSPSVEEPTWTLLNCEAAVGNYGPSGQIIGDCHPRNFFCCSLPGEKLQFPWQSPAAKELVYSPLSTKYSPLPEGEKGCPQGWSCDPDVKNYNQYKDASQPLKELLSCMRADLDAMQKGGSIGRISSISDSKLYKGTCSWGSGPTSSGGCSHTYEVKYGKERVSAHYGGVNCRFEKKSYAVDFGDEENADYLIKATKDCRSDAYINFRTPGHYDHVHISIGQAEECGGN